MSPEDNRSGGRAAPKPDFRRVGTPARAWKLQWTASRKNGCPGFWRADPTYRVWAKPRKRKPYVPPREKIAADLGRLLGLPVAPALLTRVRRGRRARALALSGYAPAPEHRKWSRVLSDGPAWLIPPVRRWFRRHRRVLAGIWVFDTWLGNHDRTNRNVMVAYDPDQARLEAVYFYDFDASQGWIRDRRAGRRYEWRDPRPAKTTAAIRRYAEPREIRRWIRRIEELPRRRLRRIVDRQPRLCLSRRQKRLVLRALLHRRRLLRRAFREVLRR